MIENCELVFAVANVEHKHLFAAGGGGGGGGGGGVVAADMNIRIFEATSFNRVHLRIILEFFLASVHSLS